MFDLFFKVNHLKLARTHSNIRPVNIRGFFRDFKFSFVLRIFFKMHVCALSVLLRGVFRCNDDVLGEHDLYSSITGPFKEASEERSKF